MGKGSDEERRAAATIPLEESPASPRAEMASAPTLAVEGVYGAPGPSYLRQAGRERLDSVPSSSLDDPVTDEPPDRYEPLSELGEGGIGRVEVVWDAHLKREVARKVLRPEVLHASQPPSRSGSSSRTPMELRFVNEARVTAVLEHPGIIAVYELGRRPDGSIYYTMPVLRGRTMADALHGRSLEERLELLPNLEEICQAMAYAHERGVIHRDLKPENVMLGDFGETIILDWGLAKIRGKNDVQGHALASELERLKVAGGGETVAGVPLGTPYYMPPEQARGAVDAVDERSDVYALGAILYELLAGRPPHDGTTAWEVVRKVLGAPIQPPSELQPGCPPELSAIAMRALQKNPKDRYQSAKELAHDVRAFLKGGLVAAHEYTFTAHLKRFLWRRRWAIGVAALLMLGVMAAWWARGRTLQAEAARAEEARVTAVLGKVDAVLAKAKANNKRERWLEVLSARIVSLREPAVEARVLTALADPDPDVRRVAAKSLGAMGGKSAVPPLTARLQPGVEKDPSVVIAVIDALGIIGDESADDAVRLARQRFGTQSEVWNATRAAYRMIALPELPKDRKMTADDWASRARALDQKATNRSGQQLALDAYRRALKLAPKHFRALDGRAGLRARLGDLEGALQDLEALLEVRGRDASLHRRMAVVLQGLERDEEAIAALDRAVKLAPDHLDALRVRGELRTMRHRYPGARADLDAVLKARPDDGAALYALGNWHAHQNDLPAALATYERAVRAAPQLLAAKRARAALFFATGDLDSADAVVERFLTDHPQDARMLSIKAQLAQARNLPKRARLFLSEAVRRNPEDPDALVARAVHWHVTQGDHDRAMQDVEAAMKLVAPDQKWRYQMVGLVLWLRQGKPEKVKQWLGRHPMRRPIRRFQEKVLALLHGGFTLATVEDAWRRPPERCTLRLAAAIRMELIGDRKLASELYRGVEDVFRPASPTCQLAAASATALSEAK